MIKQRLYELKTYCTISWLVVYVTIAATYLCFFRTLEETRKNALTGEQASLYDREAPTYPYKSHGQWLKAAYGMTGCIIVLIFNGVPSLLQNPVDLSRFIAAYLTIPVFAVFILAYKARKWAIRGVDRRKGEGRWAWLRRERSNDLRFVQVTDLGADGKRPRKGKFELPDGERYWTRRNMRFVVAWIWVWLK